MRFSPDLKTRCRQPELMDDPAIDAESHRQALDGLARLNVFSRSSSLLWPHIRRLSNRLENRPIRLLDIACGGGDVAIGLWRKAERSKLELQITGCDISDTAIQHATARANAASAQIQFLRLDVLNDDIPTTYDIVTCSLFLHHLDEADANRLLQRMAGAAEHMLLINDLMRTKLAWWGAFLLGRLVTRSNVVHTDGPLSVQAAFTAEEALDLAKQAGLNAAVIETHFWQQRFVLRFEK